jgi:hypothetical protein
MVQPESGFPTITSGGSGVEVARGVEVTVGVLGGSERVGLGEALAVPLGNVPAVLPGGRVAVLCPPSGVTVGSAVDDIGVTEGTAVRVAVRFGVTEGTGDPHPEA